MKHVISIPKAFKDTFSKTTAVGFCLDVLTVIIGIAITFAIQGLIDDKRTQSDLRSALELVADELTTCKEDLASCAQTIADESRAAEYFLLNKDCLLQCPQDSVMQYGMRLVYPTVLTLSEEAVDLIKNSSLFQAIGDDELSLAILQAYDICNVLLTVFNDHENDKSALLKKACKTEGFSDMSNTADLFDFPKMMRDEDARATLVTLRMTSPSVITRGFPFIDAAVTKIEEYLAD